MSSILTWWTIDNGEFISDNKDMAQRRCSRCKRFLSKKVTGRVCHKCRAKKRRNKFTRKRGRALSDRAITNLQYCHDYLHRHPCIDCGEADIVVLQFDHVRGRKRGNVSSLARRGLALDIIKKEIDKCEIRCANCHVRKTAKEQNWYKAKGA